MIRLGLGVIVIAACSTARADNEDAKALFDRATEHFRQRQFHDAALLYQRAYELHHDADLLYDSAQAFRLGGEPKQALLLYKSYRSAKPNAPNHEQVESRIHELENVATEPAETDERTPKVAPAPVAIHPAASPDPQLPPPPAVTARGRAIKIGGIVLCALATGAVVGGIVTAVLSNQAYDSINGAAKAREAFDPSMLSAARSNSVASGVLFGVGGAAAIAGGVLLGIGGRETHSESRVTLTPMASQTMVGAAAIVRF